MFLKDLRASGNKLTGEIPESYYGLANLEGLHLDANQLVGELPQMPEPMFDGLQEFSIHTNGFSGRFPVEQFEDTLQLSEYSWQTIDTSRVHRPTHHSFVQRHFLSTTMS